MRPTNANPKAMAVVEREIRDLELKLEGGEVQQVVKRRSEKSCLR